MGVGAGAGADVPLVALASVVVVVDVVVVVVVGHWHGSQVKAASSPAAHAGEATLGVYPSAQAAMQVPPSAIEVTPLPQAPLEAALATEVGTAHASVVEWQVRATSKSGPNSPCMHTAVA